jgi:hypothetical protein
MKALKWCVASLVLRFGGLPSLACVELLSRCCGVCPTVCNAAWRRRPSSIVVLFRFVSYLYVPSRLACAASALPRRSGVAGRQRNEKLERFTFIVLMLTSNLLAPSIRE